MLRRLHLAGSLVIGIALVGVLSGCTSTTPSDPQPPGSTPSATSAPSDPSDLDPAPPGATVDTDDDPSGPQRGPVRTVPPVQSAPSWDSASRRSVLQAGTRAMITYARPQLSYSQWWKGFGPLLSAGARMQYRSTDPARIGVTTIRRPATLVDARSAYIGVVQVPTEDGPYRVLLSREDARAPWLVERIILPDSVSSR